MNASRRKEIQRALDMMTEAQQILTPCSEEEQEYFDNMPESLQGGEKGDRAQECADNLQSAADEIETAVDTVNQALEA